MHGFCFLRYMIFERIEFNSWFSFFSSHSVPQNYSFYCLTFLSLENFSIFPLVIVTNTIFKTHTHRWGLCLEQECLFQNRKKQIQYPTQQLGIHNTCTAIFSVLSWSTFFYLNLQKKKKKLFVDFSTLLPEKSKKCPSPGKPWSSIQCLVGARLHPPQPIRKPCLKAPPSLSTTCPTPFCMEPTPLGVSLGSQVSWKQGSRLSEARGFGVLRRAISGLGAVLPGWVLVLRLQSHRQLSDLGAGPHWMPPLLSGSAMQAPLPCIHTPMWPGLLVKSFFIQSHLPALD